MQTDADFSNQSKAMLRSSGRPAYTNNPRTSLRWKWEGLQCRDRIKNASFEQAGIRQDQFRKKFGPQITQIDADLNGTEEAKGTKGDALRDVRQSPARSRIAMLQYASVYNDN